MTGMEIFLIVVGIAAIIGSFVFSEKLEKADTNAGNRIDNVSEEAIQKKVNEAVDSILDEKVEATEVRIEKILNEKIMAVGEYSDNVMSDINKNHDEVMFLYGMLNDKEKDIKKAVIDVENLKKSIKQNVSDYKSAEVRKDLTVNETENQTENEGENGGKNQGENQRKENGKPAASGADKNRRTKAAVEPKEQKAAVSSSSKNSGVAMSAKEAREKSNNNRKILDLYKQGKTSIEIAKELKLGMGEVRLVIDLYKNR